MNNLFFKLNKNKPVKPHHWLEKGALALGLKKPKVNQRAKWLKLGLIILLSASLTFIVVRQIALWRLRSQLTAKMPLLSIYDPVRLKTRLKLGDKDLLIIDLRSKKEFSKGHVRSAINIAWQEDLSAWLKQFKKQSLKNKTIILYEHSQASVLPQELSLYLKKEGYPVYYLAIGYNEWRHFYTFWLPEKDWNSWQPEQFSDLPE